jgi:hypothetical protein
MGSQRAEIVDVDRGDDGAAGKVSDGHEECVDRVFRATAGRAEQAARAHPCGRVHRVNQDTLASKLAEDGGIRGPAANELGEHGGDGCNWKLTPPHLVNQSADPISTSSRAVCDR